MHFNESHKEKKISFSSVSFDTNLRKVFIGIIGEDYLKSKDRYTKERYHSLRTLWVKIVVTI